MSATDTEEVRVEPAAGEAATAANGDLVEVAEYILPRRRATIAGLVIGVALGFVNARLGLDFTPRLELFASLAAAIVVVIVLHEGVHGAVGRLLGHRPVFGFEPPLVYTTFATKIPRGHLVAIALAPLIVLDVGFAGLYAMGQLELFAALAFLINTIGAVGDLWIVLRVLPCARGSLIEDRKSGVAVWLARPADR